MKGCRKINYDAWNIINIKFSNYLKGYRLGEEVNCNCENVNFFIDCKITKTKSIDMITLALRTGVEDMWRELY